MSLARGALSATLAAAALLAACDRPGGREEEEGKDIAKIYAPGTRLQCNGGDRSSRAAVATGVDEDTVTVRYDGDGTATLPVADCQPVIGATPHPR